MDKQNVINVCREKMKEGQLSVPDALHAYRGLQILHFHMNEYFGKGAFTLWVFFATGMATFGIFAIICFHHLLGVLELTWAISLVVFTITADLMLFGSTNSLNMKSQCFLNQMLERNQTKWLNKDIKSVPSLRIQFGSFFYSQPSTVLTCLGFITENVINLVIGYGR